MSHTGRTSNPLMRIQTLAVFHLLKRAAKMQRQANLLLFNIIFSWPLISVRTANGKCILRGWQR